MKHKLTFTVTAIRRTWDLGEHPAIDAVPVKFETVNSLTDIESISNQSNPDAIEHQKLLRLIETKIEVLL